MGPFTPRLFRAFAGGAALFAWAGTARAEPPDGGTLEEVRAYENRLRPFTVLGDALMVLSGHFSVEAQVVPWVHHAFRLNPFCTVGGPNLPFVSLSIANALNNSFQLSCGGEIGYRYYSGERGANGFFAGPSAIFGHTHSDAGVDASSRPVAAADLFYAGGAIDVGVQGIHESGLTVGGGAGLILFRYFDTGAHLKPDPRVFIDVGYSFP